VSINSSTLRRLAELSLAPDQMAGVLTIIAEMAEADEERKRKDRERKFRGKSEENPRKETGNSGTPPNKERSPTPPKEINPSEPNGSDSLAREFDEFWAVWPNKVAKKPAWRAFKAARKRDDHETIIDGVRRYARTKPEGREWMNPATFLNGDRWNDDPEPNQHQARPRSQLDRVFGALAEIGQELDDPGGGRLDSSGGTDTDAENGGGQPDFVHAVTPRLRAV
jgi:hypothetical protein